MRVNEPDKAFPYKFPVNAWIYDAVGYLLLATCLSSMGCVSQSRRFFSYRSTAASTVVGSNRLKPNGTEYSREQLASGHAVLASYGVPKQEPTQLVTSAAVLKLEADTPKTLDQETMASADRSQGSTRSDIANSPLNQMAQWLSQYVIEPGDSLDVKFRITKDLNEVVTVRPDGMISLQIVGDIPAAGYTCEQLRQTLATAYSKHLQNPDIAVIIRTFSGNCVYIGGEVNIPGRVALNAQMTTVRAIIMAGGFKDTADQRRVLIRHVDGSCCECDLKCISECTNNVPDVLLKPYDIVYVPKSHIAKVNLFVEQYIDKVLPFSRSFGIFINQVSPAQAQ